VDLYFQLTLQMARIYVYLYFFFPYCFLFLFLFSIMWFFFHLLFFFDLTNQIDANSMDECWKVLFFNNFDKNSLLHFFFYLVFLFLFCFCFFLQLVWVSFLTWCVKAMPYITKFTGLPWALVILIILLCNHQYFLSVIFFLAELHAALYVVLNGCMLSCMLYWCWAACSADVVLILCYMLHCMLVPCMLCWCCTACCSSCSILHAVLVLQLFYNAVLHIWMIFWNKTSELI